MLICHGGNVGGYTLFVKDKKPHYVQIYVGAEEFQVVSNADVRKAKSACLRVRETGKPRLTPQRADSQGPALYKQEVVGERHCL